MGTTNQKLTYLNTTKQLLKTEINKINNVLTDESTFRSYPQELFNGYLDVLNNGTDTLWNNLEKVSQTGTEPVLEGVETAPMKMVPNGNTSQDGTPTPDTPVEVKVVTGNNVVNVQGKNILNLYDGEYGYVTNSGNVTRVNNQFCSSYIDILPNSSYVVSVNQTIRNIGIAFFDDNKNIILPRHDNLNKNNVVITSPTNAAYIRVWFDDRETMPIPTAELLYNTRNAQLEQGSTVTDYTPFSKKNYPISLGTRELSKIGDYQDYLYKNNGKWYEHKRNNKHLLKPTSVSLEENGIRARYTVPIPVNTYPPAYCNYFGIGTSYSEVVNTSGNTPNLLNINATGTLLCNVGGYTTTNEYIDLFANNDIYLYYPLATPTETEITNTTLIEQLEAISKAKSVKDKTYITQTNEELPFILDVEAIKEYEVN